MNVRGLLRDLSARGVKLAADGDRLDIDAPDDVLTDELLITIRNHKTELLALLRSKPIERPRLGSCARPMPVRGTKARLGNSCLWTNCQGFVVGRGSTLYECSRCGTWFELLPLNDGLREALSLCEALDARPHSNDYTDWTDVVM